MFDDEGPFGALQCRQDHDDAKAISPIAHHGQGEQQVRGPLRRLSLELQKNGDRRISFMEPNGTTRCSRSPSVHCALKVASSPGVNM